MRGAALAFSWLTVLPVRGPDVDRRVAAGAIAWAPVVGLLLGAAGGALLAGLTAARVPPLVAGLLVVGALAAATRGMHVDGLADTADGLGCYGPPERALAVMRDGGAGPFGVVTLVVALGAQAAALAALATRPLPEVLAAGALAAACSRSTFAWACRRGVPAARPEGLGALVAGTQPWWAGPVWWVVLAAAGWWPLGWHAPAAVAVGAAVAAALQWHTTRRFGGTTGDVLGASTELATTGALVVLVAGLG